MQVQVDLLLAVLSILIYMCNTAIRYSVVT